MKQNTPDNSTIISQFDIEYKEMLLLMKKNTENVTQNMMNSLEYTLLSLPDCIKHMKLKDLMEIHHGDLNHAIYFPHQTLLSVSKNSSRTPTGKDENIRSENFSEMKRTVHSKTPTINWIHRDRLFI